MSTWNLNFGMVEHWNDNNLKHETVQMKIKHDDSLDMPVIIEIEDDCSKSIQSSTELIVNKIQSPYGNIEICGDIFYFSSEQISIIEGVMPYWKCDSNTAEITDYGNVIYLGLVIYYDPETHDFVLSDLEINREIPISMRIKEYGSTTKMTTKIASVTSQIWNSEFVKFQNDYQLYNICSHMFLLNDSQAEYIDNLQL